MKYFFYSILLLSLCSCASFNEAKIEDGRAIEIHDEKLDDKMRGKNMLHKLDANRKKIPLEYERVRQTRDEKIFDKMSGKDMLHKLDANKRKIPPEYGGKDMLDTLDINRKKSPSFGF